MTKFLLNASRDWFWDEFCKTFPKLEIALGLPTDSNYLGSQCNCQNFLEIGKRFCTVHLCEFTSTSISLYYVSVLDFSSVSRSKASSGQSHRSKFSTWKWAPTPSNNTSNVSRELAMGRSRAWNGGSYSENWYTEFRETFSSVACSFSNVSFQTHSLSEGSQIHAMKSGSTDWKVTPKHFPSDEVHSQKSHQVYPWKCRSISSVDQLNSSVHHVTCVPQSFNHSNM